MLLTSNRLAIAGLVFLALGIGGTVFLITDVLFGGGLAGGTTGILAAALAWLWFGLPILRGIRGPDHTEPRD